MVFDRLKDILKANINDKLDKFSDLFDENNEATEERNTAYQERVDKEYENYKQQQNQYQGGTTTNNAAQEAQYYKDLELSNGASFDQIKKAYRKMVKKYHPDLYHNDPEKLKVAQEITRKINEAFVYFEKKFDK